MCLLLELAHNSCDEIVEEDDEVTHIGNFMNYMCNKY